MYIIGAGLAGCIAGILNSDALILEGSRCEAEMPIHRALLRFRSDKIGKICGIEFKKVMVHKSAYYEGKEYRGNLPLRLSNMYSRKVTDGYYERSILDLSSVERWIAPEDFHSQLLRRCNGRITYAYKVRSIGYTHINDDIGRGGAPVISTMPMNIMANMARIKFDFEFGNYPITVNRYRIKHSDIYQTMYYPDPNMSAYRASIMKDMLIIERLQFEQSSNNDESVLESLGLETKDLEFIDSSKQTGKIFPIPDRVRKDIILQLTMKYGIYSLGRFAVWKNILLDDVFDDALRIRQLMSGNLYDVCLNSYKE